MWVTTQGQRLYPTPAICIRDTLFRVTGTTTAVRRGSPSPQRRGLPVILLEGEMGKAMFSSATVEWPIGGGKIGILARVKALLGGEL